MPCFRPLNAWRSISANPLTGKYKPVFSFKLGNKDMPMSIPCGQCRWCRLEKSRQWAMRAVHESKCWDKNCFITLTYSDEFLPANGSVDYNAPVLFMKRLRERFGSGIRSFGCAEYGEKFSRPHYHLCLFNFDFPDKRHTSTASSGFRIYESEILSDLWKFGRHSIGDLTFESAAYTARYVCKKITGDIASSHYGERLPEKTVCVSRRPGLGKLWFDEFRTDVTNFDEVIFDGVSMRPPKYYDRLFELAHPDEYAITRRKRELSRRACRCVSKYCLHVFPDNEFYRLRDREFILETKFVKLERGFEYGT